MPGQNRYNISYDVWDEGWDEDYDVWKGNTWQDAIHNWTDGWMDSYTVLSETPSEDGRSGLLMIQEDKTWRANTFLVWKVKATVIDPP